MQISIVDSVDCCRIKKFLFYPRLTYFIDIISTMLCSVLLHDEQIRLVNIFWIVSNLNLVEGHPVLLNTQKKPHTNTHLMEC